MPVYHLLSQHISDPAIPAIISRRLFSLYCSNMQCKEFFLHKICKITKKVNTKFIKPVLRSLSLNLFISLKFKRPVDKFFFLITVIFPHLPCDLLQLLIKLPGRYPDGAVPHNDHLLQSI